MAIPQRGPRTDKYNIDVVWTPLFGADLCGSQTISYNLQWDKGMGGTSNWFDLIGLTDNYLQLSYLVTFDSIVGGSNYQFRIRAENSEGFSKIWSPVATITANAIPDKVSIPTTEVFLDTKVKISWSYPSDNFSPLTQFEILLQGNDEKWYSHPDCSGQDTSVIFCVVTMISLRQSDFLLQQNDVVIAKVRA